jgi:thiol-disulfide isomerase/thioredoxin
MSRLGLRRYAALPAEGYLPGFDGATGWLNTTPLTVADLHGKVVLVDFWTYTCINWLRTLGYVRAWHEKYRDQGLVVVGVHTPEFPFERDVDNVRWAAEDMRVEYPIAVDSDYGVWRAFDNHYWPAVYIADAEGRIRHHHFGGDRRGFGGQAQRPRNHDCRGAVLTQVRRGSRDVWAP